MLRVACSSSSTVIKRAVGAVTAASRMILSASPIPNRHPQLVERSYNNIPNNLTFCSNFSTAFSSKDRKKVDRKLRKGLTSEIKSLDSSITKVSAPADFPFCIEDEEEGEVVLRRELNGEEIRASSIEMPETIEEDLVVDPDHGVCIPGMLSLEVEVRKKDGNSIKFDVELCPHKLYVDAYFIDPTDKELEELDYDWCYNIDGEMQIALQEYLKVRGIRTCYAEFMYKYMVGKYKRTYLHYLKQLHQFIKQ